ncbi:hypothetical protein OUZ56_018353 [Daphnia magna]|uniref:Uncharacterized protein n=1 Tax=Daphnia magna TaxID=35525 RepID=A0ABQ9Z8L7_9CRUS|nr:hypothetical protein OUZ56_018353 [Daphnia magna]
MNTSFVLGDQVENLAEIRLNQAPPLRLNPDLNPAAPLTQQLQQLQLHGGLPPHGQSHALDGKRAEPRPPLSLQQAQEQPQCSEERGLPPQPGGEDQQELAKDPVACQNSIYGQPCEPRRPVTYGYGQLALVTAARPIKPFAARHAHFRHISLALHSYYGKLHVRTMEGRSELPSPRYTSELLLSSDDQHNTHGHSNAHEDNGSPQQKDSDVHGFLRAPHDKWQLPVTGNLRPGGQIYCGTLKSH